MYRVALAQVVVQMEPSEAYEVIHYIPAPSLPYSQPNSCYTLVRLPEDDPTAGMCYYYDFIMFRSSCNTHANNKIHVHGQYNSLWWKLFCRLSTVSCTFSCTMKYLVRDCDPNTGEPDDDGYDDEYVVRDHSTPTNYLNKENELCIVISVNNHLCPFNSSPLILRSFVFFLPSSSVAGRSGGDGCRPHPEGFETKLCSGVGRSGRRLWERRNFCPVVCTNFRRYAQLLSSWHLKIKVKSTELAFARFTQPWSFTACFFWDLHNILSNVWVMQQLTPSVMWLICGSLVQRRSVTSSASWECSHVSARIKFLKTRTRTSSSSLVGVGCRTVGGHYVVLFKGLFLYR